MQNLPSNQQFVELAKVAGLPGLGSRARGSGRQERANVCPIGKFDQPDCSNASDATSQFPDFSGTPTFIINGTMLDKTATWETLEPQLKKALGG